MAEKHFNKATVWGRVDGVPTRKKSNEGKGEPYWRLKVLCPSGRGNVWAYGRIWNKEKAEALVAYLKLNPAAGVKLVGFLNQYDHARREDDRIVGTTRRSNFTWYDWQPDKSEDPRAAFVLTGDVVSVKDDLLMLRVERQQGKPEQFELYARDLASFEAKKVLAGDLVQVKGYLQSKSGEDEFGVTEDTAILPCFDVDDLKVRGDDFA